MTQLDMTCAIDHQGTLLPAYPILMPESWQRAPTQVCTPIIRGLTLPDVPLLAPVHFVGDPNSGEFRRAYVRTERLEAIGKTEQDYFAAAFHNLRQRHATWKEQMPGILLCDDDFLAAERILDINFMLEAERLLGGGPLVVGIPQRAHLFATTLGSITANAAHGHAFAQVVASMFSSAGEHGITPWPFTVIGGRINSILEIE